jgi:hypothetical protein
MRIDEGGGSASPTPETQIEDIAAGVRDFAGAAGSGFFVSERGGQAMLEVLASFRQDLATVRQDMANFKQEPLLGTTPGAQRVAPHVQKSADSLDFVMKGLNNVLNDLETGLRKAMKSYQTGDTGNAQTVKDAYNA